MIISPEDREKQKKMRAELVHMQTKLGGRISIDVIDWSLGDDSLIEHVNISTTTSRTGREETVMFVRYHKDKRSYPLMVCRSIMSFFDETLEAVRLRLDYDLAKKQEKHLYEIER